MTDLLTRPSVGLPQLADATGGTGMVVYADTLCHLYEVAKRAFAGGTGRFFCEPSGRSAAAPESAISRRRTPSASVADPEVLVATIDAPVLRALEELRVWLNVSYDELADIVGVGESLVHYWRRRHRAGYPVRPRASSVELLWRIHATLRAVAETVEGEGGHGAVQLWLRQSTDSLPSPLQLLTEGRVEEVEARARPLLFDRSPSRASAWRRIVPESDQDLEGAPSGDPIAYEDADFG
jgi:transposase-like protein